MSASFEIPWTLACQVTLCMWFPRLGMEWVAIFFSRESFRPRDWACVSCIGRQILYAWATRKTLLFPFSSVQLLSQVWPFVTTRPLPTRLPYPSPNPELAQTHVHWVGDAIQPSHLLSSTFPPAFSLSQHQDLFKWLSSSHQVAKVLEPQLQHQSFQWTPRADLL